MTQLSHLGPAICAPTHRNHTSDSIDLLFAARIFVVALFTLLSPCYSCNSGQPGHPAAATAMRGAFVPHQHCLSSTRHVTGTAHAAVRDCTAFVVGVIRQAAHPAPCLLAPLRPPGAPTAGPQAHGSYHKCLRLGERCAGWQYRLHPCWSSLCPEESPATAVVHVGMHCWLFVQGSVTRDYL